MSDEFLKRSPIRWAGSKRRLIPQLRELAPSDYKRYIEPFCGSMCLLLALKPEKAIVGDLNAELIHFYRMIRWRPAVVSAHAESWGLKPATYYKLRAQDPKDLFAEQRAARFLYLNRFCFNGVYRTNASGSFNVPIGSHTGALPSKEELMALGRLLRSTELKCVDFEKLVRIAKRNDFIYLDPPYAGRDVRDRGEYGENSFRAPDIDRLKKSLHAASKRGAKILLSYADLPVVRDAFAEWNISEISVARNVSGFAAGRGYAKEVIIRNYA